MFFFHSIIVQRADERKKNWAVTRETCKLIGLSSDDCVIYRFLLVRINPIYYTILCDNKFLAATTATWVRFPN